MAEALLADRLARRHIDVVVSSAGELGGGIPATGGSVRAMAMRGLDLAHHRSRTVDPAMVAAADLVVGMARSHVREAILSCPEAWPRTFTLKELVRRAEAAGARPADEPWERWLGTLGEGRERADLLGGHPEDDIADPIGGSEALYRRVADEIDDLVERLVELAFPGGTVVASGTSGEGAATDLEEQP